MLKEIKEEIKFIIKHPLLVLGFMGMLSGVIPALIEAVVNKLV